MNDKQDEIKELRSQLDSLILRQELFFKEINDIKKQISYIESDSTDKVTVNIECQNPLPLDSRLDDEKVNSNSQSIARDVRSEIQDELFIDVIAEDSPRTNKKIVVKKFNLEKFIGENVISKIGILITIIGVAIGAKYSIENGLVSPLTRIIMGYLLGIGLMLVGIKLKRKYANYSAVLVSGSMAIMYFITYSAFAIYELIPQSIAFLLMLVFIVFTVIAALSFNKQIIAHIGLVGAYAVPIVLSTGTGQVSILFAYMAIINIGILLISIKKYWKKLSYVSFAFSWFIYIAWYIKSYNPDYYFNVAVLFLIIFFVIFYATFLAYKLRNKEMFKIDDILLILLNAFIFYGISMFIMMNHEIGGKLLGLITLGNALIHFGVSVVIYKLKLADRNLFFLIAGLVLVFITIAIPIQLDAVWVTLLWVIEAGLVYWIGRTKNVPVYEWISFPLMFLAFISISHDWLIVYESTSFSLTDTRFMPFLNINFLSSVLFIVAFGFINYIKINTISKSVLDSKRSFRNIISISIPAILLISIFVSFCVEISVYWNQLYLDSKINIIVDGSEYLQYFYNNNLKYFGNISLICFALFYSTILVYVNRVKIRSNSLGNVSIGLVFVSLIVFLLKGLFVFSELRENYLDQILVEYYNVSIMNIGLRYISFVFVALAFVVVRKYVNQRFIKLRYKAIFEYVMHITVLWIASSEFISLLDLMGSDQSYKLGLSILWGVYSLFLIVLGIWKQKRHLRVGAIILFFLTLVKLFLYDISHLNTISKTIVLVSLGLLLLIISFLYTKYKNIISDEN